MRTIIGIIIVLLILHWVGLFDIGKTGNANCRLFTANHCLEGQIFHLGFSI